MKMIYPLVVLILFNWNCQSTQKTAEAETPPAPMNLTQKNTNTAYEVGDIAEDFKLKGTDDQWHSLSDMSDAKGFIVIFTCNHCPYSIAYEDRIIALQDKFGPQGYPVVAINPNDPAVQPKDGFEEMKVRAKEKNFNFPYLFDEGQKTYPKYGATRTPHVFVLQKEKKGLRVKYIGAIDNNYEDANDVSEYYVQDAVNALLEKKEVPLAQTKAIGCSIKSAK